MTEIREMQERADHLRGQLGAEFKYLKELGEDILREEYDLKHDNTKGAIKDIENARRLLRGSVGKTERRVFKEEGKVEEDIKELMAYLPAKLRAKLQHEEEVMKPAFAALVAELSRNNTQLRSQITALQKELEQYEQNTSSEAEQRILSESNVVLEKVKKLIGWVQGLEVELKEYEELLAYLREL